VIDLKKLQIRYNFIVPTINSSLLKVTMNKSFPLVVPAAIALLTIGNLIPVAHAYPGNRERYDCYRKSDNQFSFGSPENASNSRVICTPNPDYRSRPSRPRSSSPRQRKTSTRQNVRRTVYKNVYHRADNTVEKVAIGFGSFAFGTLIGSVFSPWGWGSGWSGWGGWGDTFIDNSINNVDFGDLNVDVGDIGDVDASIGDIDFGDVDASGDAIDVDASGDDIGVTDFGSDDTDVDASSDDVGATDFGGNDDDGDGFQENDFGDDDGGDFDDGGFDDGGFDDGGFDDGGFDDGGFDGGDF
jgi:hypothetical protein